MPRSTEPLVVEAFDRPPSGGGTARRWRIPRLIATHCAGLVLAAVAVFFVWWFWYSNPAMVPAGLRRLMLLAQSAWMDTKIPEELLGPGIFEYLWLERWGFGGGSFDGLGLLWGVLGAALFTLIGWFYLEGLELYLERKAQAALALVFGLGLSGFVLECLAIPYLLDRATVAAGLGALLLILGLRAAWRVRRPPETGRGGDAGVAEQLMRRSLARELFAETLTHPIGIGARLFRGAALFLIGAITLLNFYHALLYPETYWDSLILYLGYARMTFLEGGFPVKVTGQVGIGLGANYPHLFSVLGSGIATAAGQWSELPQRLIAPLCGLATTVLIYLSALRLTRHVNFALGVALLYRATPLVIMYDQYASDYALLLLFGAAFLYLALLYIETGLSGYFTAATLLIALSMHLNYLMGILWAPWLVMVVLAHAGWRPLRLAGEPAEPDAWTRLERRAPLGAFLGSARFWGPLALAIVIGSTWYVRNWIVTGNPVYAFFYDSLFKSSLNVNPEVMKAAEQEWMGNGGGIGLYGATLAERLRGAWGYFVADRARAFRVEPLMAAFALGGLIAWLARVLARVLAAPLRRGRARRIEAAARETGRGVYATEFEQAYAPLAEGHPLRFGAVVLTLLFALLAFHFVMAPFYLYQVMKIIPCMALLVALAWPFWRLAPWRWVFGALVLATGLAPGLATGLMGGKVASPNLVALHHPLPTPLRMYQWVYPDQSPLMIDYINKHLKGQRLLTHENRHLMFDPSIQLVHLDDWDMQQLWREPDPAERVRTLLGQGIQYYLFVPNEVNCPTNARMGTGDWPQAGLAQLEKQYGENRLYRLTMMAEGDQATTSTAATAPSAGEVSPEGEVTPEGEAAAAPAEEAPVATPKPEPTAGETPEAAPEATPAPTPEATAEATAPAATPAPEPAPAAATPAATQSEPAPTPEATPAAEPTPTPTPTETPQPAATEPPPAEPEATPEASPTPAA